MHDNKDILMILVLITAKNKTIIFKIINFFILIVFTDQCDYRTDSIIHMSDDQMRLVKMI